MMTTHNKLWYCHQREYGKGSRRWNRQGLIRKYTLNICRQCFRENAEKIGFKKLD